MSERKEATIKCVPTKSGGLAFSLVFEGKEQPIQNFPLPKESNSRSCTVEKDKGQLVKIFLDGKEYVKVANAAPSRPNIQQPYQNRGASSSRPPFRPQNPAPQQPAPALSAVPAAAASPAGRVNPARAPYNFVPLDAKIIPGESRLDGDRYLGGFERVSGYITLNIETKTPLYIRGTLTEEQAKQKVESKNLPEFFGPNGRLRIPGSSYRGMVRTLLEIASWSQFKFIDKENNYFYRALADKSDSLNSSYQGKTATPFPRVKPLAKAGYLEKINGVVKLIPAIQHADFGNASIFRVNQQDILDAGIPDVLQMQVGNVINQDYKMSRQMIWYKPEDDVLLPGQNSTPDYHNHHGDLKMFYGTIKAGNIKLDTQSDVAGWYMGWLICSGAMHNKKMHYIVTDKDDSAHPLDVPPELIKLYKDDLSKVIKQGMHVLPEKDNGNDGNPVPCYYLEEHGQVVAFGHTQFIRIPYTQATGDFLRQDSLGDKTFDLVETIFGNIGNFAGRVTFEDAEIELKHGQTQENIQLSKKQPRILSTPKPTTFNHYLRQSSEPTPNFSKLRADVYGNLRNRFNDAERRVLDESYTLRNGKYEPIRPMSMELLQILSRYPALQGKFIGTFRGISDWNKPHSVINGHKLYWHRRNGNNWIAQVTADEPVPDDQHTIIKPIKDGVTFTGRIRFENLSKVELGALLFVLDLQDGVDEELCHKLGMGKPLGLGSVKITPELVTINRTERYGRLFDDAGLFRGENHQTSDDIPCLKKDFALYILRHLKGDSTYSPMDPVAELWNTPRLTQLRHLLNWKNVELPNWVDRTRYLEIEHPQNGNEYKMRRLLPSPQHVVESCHV